MVVDAINQPSESRYRQLVLQIQNPAGRLLPAPLITARLYALAGLHYVYTSIQTEMIWLVYDPGRFKLADVAYALAEIGFTVETSSGCMLSFTEEHDR